MAAANKRSKTRRTGQGTVYQRKDGRWEGAITHGYNENGNPKRHRIIKKTRAEAVQALNDLITKMNLGVPVAEEKQTVGDFLQFWLREHVGASRAPKTHRYYEQMVRLYIAPAVGHFPLGKISSQHIQAMINNASAKGLSSRTVSGIRATIRAALNVAWRWNLIRENPAARVTSPKIVRQEPVFLSSEELRGLLKKSEGHYISRLIELALLTGLRLGEATGLTWDDVDFENAVLKVRSQLQRVESKLVLRELKGASSRRVLALSESALQCLRDQKAEQLLWKASFEEDSYNPLGLVFTHVEGRPLDPKTIDKHLKAIAAKAGIQKKLSFHKLRHTVATHMAAQGVPLNLVKDQLGHSQISLTMNTYAHAVPTALRSAANILDAVVRGEKD